MPLILISAEETLATFEQHKKLKSRADEYMLKPLDGQELLVKVGGLVSSNLSAAAADDDEVHELDADSDIVMADDDDVDIVSSASTDDGRSDGDASRWPSTRELRHRRRERRRAGTPREQHVLPERRRAPTTPFEGEKFDPETQAAFAALEAGSPEGARPPSGDMVDLRNLWSDDDLPPNAGLGEAAGRASTRPTAAPRRRSREAVRRATGFDPDVYRTGETLGPEPLVADALLASALHDARHERRASTCRRRPTRSPSRTSRPRPAAGSSPSASACRCADDGRAREVEARNAELEARIHSLENERQTLRKEIEEARERFTQSATFSKEREFLGLREIINKKEKDILDLRDALDAKERQILDHKDKIRELDRARRDLEEKHDRASSGAWSPPTRRSPSWRRTARSRPSARRG